MARAIIPAALVAAVVAGLSGGVTVAVLKHDVRLNSQRLDRLSANFENFRRPGTRFTKDQGDQLASRIFVLEDWRFEHIRWGLEKTGKWEALLAEHDRRLAELEKHRRALLNNSWKHKDDAR